jgi:hypothetical protein
MQTDTKLSAKERSRIAISQAQERARLKKLTEPEVAKVETRPVDASQAAPQYQVTSHPPSQQLKAPESSARPLTEPLPQKVEIWVEIVNRTGRDVFGWTYRATRRGSDRVIVWSYKNHWLTQLAFSNSEPRALPWLFTNLLAEFLVTNWRKNPWVAVVMDQLRNKVFKPVQPGSGSPKDWHQRRRSRVDCSREEKKLVYTLKLLG